MLVTIDIFKSTQGVEESERSKRASFIFPVVYFLLWPPLLWNMNLQVKQLFFFYIQVQHNNKLIKASWCQSTIVRLHSQTPFLLNHTHILLHTFRNILLTLHISYHSNNALSPFSIVHPFSFLQINPNEIKCTFLKASPPCHAFFVTKKEVRLPSDHSSFLSTVFLLWGQGDLPWVMIPPRSKPFWDFCWNRIRGERACVWVLLEWPLTSSTFFSLTSPMQ